MKYVKLVLCSFVLIHFTFTAFGQKKPISEKIIPTSTTWTDLDKKILNLSIRPNDSIEIISNFITQQTDVDSLKTRMAFLWVANNIAYDVSQLANVDLSNENLLKKTLLAFYNRKGICEDYANIFSLLLTQLGIKNYVVAGEAETGTNTTITVAHAWIAARVHNRWDLYDPTWSAGGIATTGVFRKQVSLKYYKLTGQEFIKKHMPFDYMWQLLDHPYRSLSLIESHTKKEIPGPIFIYADTIKEFEKLNNLEQSQSILNRMNEKLYPTPLFRSAILYYSNYITFLKNEISNEKVTNGNAQIESFNTATSYITEGSTIFNKYIQYKNQQFTPSKPDSVIHQMLDESFDYAKKAQKMYEEIHIQNAGVNNNMVANKKTLDELLIRIEEEKVWLDKYFKKGKIGRAFMFTSFGNRH